MSGSFSVCLMLLEKVLCDELDFRRECHTLKYDSFLPSFLLGDFLDKDGDIGILETKSKQTFSTATKKYDVFRIKVYLKLIRLTDCTMITKYSALVNVHFTSWGSWKKFCN